MARKQTRRGPPKKRRDPLSYEAIADAYRQELRPLPGGGPFSDYDLVHLRRFFEGRRLAAITDEAVVEYALRREEREGAVLETINGELRTLREIQRFAVKRGLIKNEDCCRIQTRHLPIPAAPSAPPRRPGDTEGFGRRRYRWFKPAAAAPTPTSGRVTRKQRNEIWARFFHDYPLSYTTPDGKPLTDDERLKILAAPPYGLRVKRSAMVKQRRR